MTSNSIFSVSLAGGLKDFNDKNNWKELSLKDESKDDSVGQANLNYDENKDLRRIYLGKNGLIVTTIFSVNQKETAALAYFEGDTTVPTYAWLNTDKHSEIEYLSINMVLSVTYSGHEYLIISSPFYFSSIEIGKNKIRGQYKIPNEYYLGWGAMAESDDSVLFITSGGVYQLAKSQLGSVSFATAIEEAKSNLWEMVSGTPNNNIENVLVHKNRLYIALSANGENTGGIVIFDTTQNSLIPPNKNIWSNTQYTSLSIYQYNVHVIVNNEYTKLEDDGSLSKNYISRDFIKDNDINRALARKEDITGKVFYKGNLSKLNEFYQVFPIGKELLISDAFGNLFVLTYQEEQVSDYQI